MFHDVQLWKERKCWSRCNALNSMDGQSQHVDWIQSLKCFAKFLDDSCRNVRLWWVSCKVYHRMSQVQFSQSASSSSWIFSCKPNSTEKLNRCNIDVRSCKNIMQDRARTSCLASISLPDFYISPGRSPRLSSSLLRVSFQAFDPTSPKIHRKFLRNLGTGLRGQGWTKERSTKPEVLKAGRKLKESNCESQVSYPISL